MKNSLILLLLIVSVFAVGCNRQATVEDADAAFCQNLQAFDDALTNLEAVSATSTVGDLKDATAEVEKAWNEVTKSANDLNDVKLDTIDEAWKNLRRTVNQIDSDDTLDAATVNVGVSVQEIKASYGLLGEVDCPGVAQVPAAQQAASDVQPAEPASDAQPAEAVPAEPVAPGFTGTFSATLTLPDATAIVMVLVLSEDGTVFEVTRPLDQASESILVGQWQDNSDGTAGVTLTQSMDQSDLAIPIVYVFKLEGDTLIAVDFDETAYGPDGFSLQRVVEPAVAADAAALAAQASSGITADAPISDTAPVTASEAMTGAAPILVIPPATPAEAPAQPADSSASAEQAAPASPLAGSWQLQQINQTSGVTYTPADSSLYVVTFNVNGTLSVTADCNTGVGAYQADAIGALTIDLSATRAYCATGSLSNQFISYLTVANSYRVDGNALGVGFSSDNGLMTFTAAP